MQYVRGIQQIKKPAGEKSTGTVRVVAAFRQIAIAEGVACFLAPHDDLDVVGKCTSVAEVVTSIRRHSPHLVLISSRWLSSVDEVKSSLSVVGIGGPMWAIVSPNVDYDTSLRASDRGVHVLVDNSVTSFDDLIFRIRSLVWNTPVVNQHQDCAETTRVVAHDDTDRKILALLSTGATNSEIAAEVYLSVQTVKNRLSRMMKEAGTTNRTELALRNPLHLPTH